jgi:hypothetical protein
MKGKMREPAKVQGPKIQCRPGHGPIENPRSESGIRVLTGKMQRCASGIFGFWARLRRRSRYENPATEPKRRPKPKRPLFFEPPAHRYSFYGNAPKQIKANHGGIKVNQTQKPKVWRTNLNRLKPINGQSQ